MAPAASIAGCLDAARSYGSGDSAPCRPAPGEPGAPSSASAPSERMPCSSSTRAPPPRRGRAGRAPRAGRCAGTPAAAPRAAGRAPRRAGPGLAGRDHAVDQPDPQRLVGGDRAAGEDQVERPAGRRSAGAAAPCRRRSAARPSAGRRRRGSRPRPTTRRSHQIASSRPPATACPSIAAITGLLSRIRVGPIGPSPSSTGWTWLPRSVPIALRSAPAQNVPPAAVQHGDALVVVGVERPERVGQGRGGRAVHRVAGLRPVDDDGGDGAGRVSTRTLIRAA